MLNAKVSQPLRASRVSRVCHTWRTIQKRAAPRRAPHKIKIAEDGMSAASSSASKNAGSVGGPPAVPHLDIDPFAIAFFDDPFPAQQALRGKRSEEHTSELQSHHDLVCRLLL